MRRFLVLGLVLAACTSNASTTTTVDVIPPPPNPGPAPTGPLLTIPPASTPPIQGFFPDGTDFLIKLHAPEPEEVTAIEAGILYEADGAVWEVGDVRFGRGRIANVPSFAEGVLRLQASNDWHVEIAFYDEFIDHLGPEADQIVTSGITTALSRMGYPILGLAPPFRWSTQYDPTGPIEVHFETFSVTTGCDDDAIACLPNQTMQVKDLSGGEPTPELTIESFFPRPLSDLYFFNVGPLFSHVSPRASPDVIWTGDEMIVWGGKSGGGSLADGAAFDPASDTWRRLSRNRDLPEGTPSRAVWAGDEMIVFSTEGTFSYDPENDSWTTASFDIGPPRLPFAVTSTHIYFISNGAPFAFNVETYQYDHILEPPVGFGAQLWETYLFVHEDTLMLSRIEGERCSGRTFWRLDGVEWSPLPETSLATPSDSDCSTANQVAVVGDEILIWDDADNLTQVFREGAWVEVDRIPLTGWESPPSGLVIGNRVLVPGGSVGAIYDADTEAWTGVQLPGSVETTQMIWTGTEVLAWHGSSPRDAWRWTPPE